MDFFETYFIPDILRQLDRVNFQMSSETRVDIYTKCFFHILIRTVIHEYILLKLTIINLYENLRNTFRVFYSRGGGVKDTEKLIRKLVLGRHKKLTHTKELYARTVTFLFAFHGSET